MRLTKEKGRSHQVRIRRTFTDEFKRQIAEAVISGQAAQLELSRKYGISPVIISRWKKEYLEGKFFENNDPDYARLEIRVKELKRLGTVDKVRTKIISLNDDIFIPELNFQVQLILPHRAAHYIVFNGCPKT